MKNEHRNAKIIANLKRKIQEQDAFRLTATDFIMTKATTQEEILFLVRANERISAFQENDFPEDQEKFEDGGFITQKRHYEILDDYEPAPSFLKTLTNEILYLEMNEEASIMQDNLSIDSLGQTSLLETIENNGRDFVISDIALETSSNIQKIDSTDQVPDIIKDSLVPNRGKSRNEGLEDYIEDKGSLSDIIIKHQIKSGKTVTAMNSSGYGGSQFTKLTSNKLDHLGSSLDMERRTQYNLHSRQVQPTNTSQKIISSRLNAYTG